MFFHGFSYQRIKIKVLLIKYNYSDLYLYHRVSIMALYFIYVLFIHKYTWYTTWRRLNLNTKNKYRNFLLSNEKNISNLGNLTLYCPSLPDYLEIKESDIPGAGLGVFAKKRIYSEEIFGPFEGKKVSCKEAKENVDPSYMWEVYLFFYLILYKVILFFITTVF